MTRSLILASICLAAVGAHAQDAIENAAMAPLGAAAKGMTALSMPGMGSADVRPLTPPPASASALTLNTGQSRILRFPTITRVVIGNPAVADVALLSKTEVLLNAKSAGETLLYVANARGSASVAIRVGITGTSMSQVATSVNQALSAMGVTADVAGSTVFLRGTVDTQDQADQAMAMAKAITPNVQSFITVTRTATGAVAQTLGDVFKPLGVTVRATGQNILVIEGTTTPENLVTINKLAGQLGAGYQVVNLVSDTRPSRQIVVHARIIDVDQSAARDLGLDYGSITTSGTSSGTGSSGASVPTISGIQQPFYFGELANGGVGRLSVFGAALRALEQNNRAKILSSPDVLVQDGHRAEFVVGGQIPVPVPQIGSGSSTIIIEFKEYGVKLVCTPRALTDNLVSMNVQPEVSTLDYANAIVLNGFQIPAFQVRRANTDVTVASGDTLVIGGLLQDQDVDTLRKIPLIGDIPFFGELFKFRSRTRTRTQLVILISPEVLPPGVIPPLPALSGVKADPVALSPVVKGINAKKDEEPSYKAGVPVEPNGSPIPASPGSGGPSGLPPTVGSVGANSSSSATVTPSGLLPTTGATSGLAPLEGPGATVPPAGSATAGGTGLGTTPGAGKS